MGEPQTFGEVEAELCNGKVIDLGLEQDYVEYTAVVFPSEYISVYMPYTDGSVTSASWWDEDHEGGRQEVLELAREWVRDTYAKNQLRLAYYAKRDTDAPLEITPAMNPADFKWPEK